MPHNNQKLEIPAFYTHWKRLRSHCFSESVTSELPQSFGDFLFYSIGNSVQILVEEIGVAVECHSRALMPEHSLKRLHISPRMHSDTRRRMPEIMASQNRHTGIAQRVAKPLLGVRALRMRGSGLLMNAASTGISENQIIRSFPLHIFLDSGHHIFRHRHITPFPRLWLRLDEFATGTNPATPNPQSPLVNRDVFNTQRGGFSPSQPAESERQDQCFVAAGRFGKGYQLLRGQVPSVEALFSPLEV